MTHTPPSNAACKPAWPRIWLLLLALLALGGAAAGYFLPAPKPTVSTENSPPGEVATRAPHAAAAQDAFQEFLLPAADIRDTQQAPSVTIGPQGQVYVCWESKTDEATKALMFTLAPNFNSKLEPLRAIATSGIFKSGGGARGGHERRMLPRLASYGDMLSVAWSDAPPDGASVRMLFAESRDGGKTFSDPATVHAGPEARPTFISMGANGQGQVAASWLDCRTGPQHVYAAVRPTCDAPFKPDALICSGQNDQGVCPCCPTASLVTTDGTVLVAYRGQVDGYRDIWIARASATSNEPFAEPVPVVPPTWKFDGCPHDGPSLAASGDWLHVAWMDARSGRQRAYYGRGRLGDLKFEVQELHAAGPGTQGNVKLAVDLAGGLHAVWEESLADELPSAEGKSGEHAGHSHGQSAGSGRAIMHVYAAHNDCRFGPPQAVRPSPGRFQTRPAIACGMYGQIVVAWTELDESGKRMVIVRRKANGQAPPHQLTKWQAK